MTSERPQGSRVTQGSAPSSGETSWSLLLWTGAASPPQRSHTLRSAVELYRKSGTWGKHLFFGIETFGIWVKWGVFWKQNTKFHDNRFLKNKLTQKIIFCLKAVLLVKHSEAVSSPESKGKTLEGLCKDHQRKEIFRSWRSLRITALARKIL